MARRGKKGRMVGNFNDEDMARSLDDLAEFDRFRSDLLKKFQRALKRGDSPNEILDMAKAIAAARLGTIAATEVDSSRALAAIKDILDRTQGKATEHKEVRHKFDKLPDEQLDALIQSQQQELDDEENETKH